MKKLYTSLLIAAAILLPAFALPATAGAASVSQFCNSNNGVSGSGTAVCNSQNNNGKTGNPFLSIAKLVLNILSVILGVAAVVIIIYQGLRMITSNGDSQTVQRAREGIGDALIGIVIAVAAQTIVLFVLNRV
jgi:hypothetical protein